MPTPELALVSSRLTARFDGRRLLVAAGRTTWTIPLRAIASAELVAGEHVRVVFAGRPETRAAHGLGDGVDLPAPNPTAAEAFHSALAKALRGSKPAEDGHSLVERVDAPSVFAAPRAALVWRYARLPLAYLLALALLGALSPLPAGERLTTLGSAALAGGAGGFLAWRFGRRIRVLWVLRSRGIGVVARIIGERTIATRGSLLSFPEVRFTTVEGRSVTAISVVSRPRFSSKRTVEVLYDPRDPGRASCRATFGFWFRTACFLLPVLPLVLGTLLLLTANLPL